jgi:hypothetical protein
MSCSAPCSDTQGSRVSSDNHLIQSYIHPISIRQCRPFHTYHQCTSNHKWIMYVDQPICCDENLCSSNSLGSDDGYSHDLDRYSASVRSAAVFNVWQNCVVTWSSFDITKLCSPPNTYISNHNPRLPPDFFLLHSHLYHATLSALPP